MVSSIDEINGTFPSLTPESILSLHPTISFYKCLRNVELTTCALPSDREELSEENVSGDATVSKQSQLSAAYSSKATKKEYSCWSLHLALLPPSMVCSGEMDEASQVNDELYSISIASSDGCELLRENWHFLLSLLLPTSAREKNASPATNGMAIHTSIKSSKEEEGSVAQSSASSLSPLEEKEETGSTPVSPEIVEQKDNHRMTPASLSDGECYHSIAVDPIKESCSRDIKQLQGGLTPKVVKELRHCTMLDRILYSVTVFLRFYGWRLHDDTRGEVDRHRNWRGRYALLKPAHIEGRSACDPEEKRKVTEKFSTGDLSVTPCSSPAYGKFNFYTSGLPHLVQSFLTIRFFQYAIRLVEFIVEEMKAERLTFLYSFVSENLVPLLENCCEIDPSHTARLRRKLRSLIESDSELSD